MKPELKPCPFCGASLPEVKTHIDGSPIRHSIKCTECPCRAEYFSSAIKQAIDHWNRRTQPIFVGLDLASGPDETVRWDGESPPTK